MASNQKNPQKKNPSQVPETHPQSHGRQPEQIQAQRHQPGEQNKENANKASDAQLNQGGTGQGRSAP